MDTMQGPQPGLMRRVIVDMMPYEVSDEDLLTLQDRLGLVPSSLDVLELDRKESEHRIKGLKPISEIITMMSGLSAQVIAEYFLMRVTNVIDDDDEDEAVPTDYLRKVIVQQNMNVIVTAAHGIVSHLIASGILVYNKDMMK